MQKDFDTWNIRKKNIDHSKRSILFSEGEVWWCALGVNIGFEQDGVNELFERPILVFKKFSNDVLWVLPLTKSIKTNPYYYQINHSEFPSSVILSQIRLISSKRLLRRMGTIERVEFFEIIKKFENILPHKH